MKSRCSKKFSLKMRVFFFFSTILLLMVGTCLFSVNRFLTRFLEKQLREDYQEILSNTCDTMEKLLWNLTLISGQILDNEEIHDILLNYQAAPDPYTRQTYYAELLDTITMLTLANTDIALMYLYDVEADNYIFQTLPVDAEQTEPRPVLYENSAFTFSGPCKSQSRFIGNPVLILNRTETLSDGSVITFSVESGYYSLDGPLHLAERKSAYLAVTGADGNLLYSTFPNEEDSSAFLECLSGADTSSFRLLQETTSQGWCVSVVIPNDVYQKDYLASMRDVILCMVLISILVGILAVWFWRSIYAPLQVFDRQLAVILSDELDAEEMHSSIPEYDRLLQRIVALQKQIREMLAQAIRQEKANAQAQLEKLRAQINPHFLLNTLNTVHWLALMNEQTEIDEITQSLAHLLSYNLDRESRFGTLAGELEALKEYVQLQKVRYSFDFCVDAPEGTELDYPCPKFLLQPLVENALAHGYREGMVIRISVEVEERIRLLVEDTGTGMDEATVERLNGLTKAGLDSSQGRTPGRAGDGRAPDEAASGRVDNSRTPGRTDGSPGGTPALQGGSHFPADGSLGGSSVPQGGSHSPADGPLGGSLAPQGGSHSPADNPRHGIGLSYVVQSLANFYTGDYRFFVESQEGKGTVITIEFPKQKGEKDYAEAADC
ncbi:MAG: histidine kinase [Eubacteriales bacterium]|nr:histidine kinase [Eubacteriales bacterium]